jgi:hypothetical protein
MDMDAGEGDGPEQGKSVAWHNMNRVVEDNKEGPWFT